MESRNGTGFSAGIEEAPEANMPFFFFEERGLNISATADY